jgi:hypothetical protein
MFTQDIIGARSWVSKSKLEVIQTSGAASQSPGKVLLVLIYIFHVVWTNSSNDSDYPILSRRNQVLDPSELLKVFRGFLFPTAVRGYSYLFY